MDTIVADLRHAVRALRRAPGFTAVAVLTLALGIGANSAIFAVVDGVLLRALPYREPATLLSVWTGRSHSKAEFARIRERARAFAEIAAVGNDAGFSLSGHGEASRVTGAHISAGLLPLLGVIPSIGAGISAAHEAPAAEPTVILSDALWRTRFGADPSVIGQSIELDGRAHMVAGVMPRDFRLPSARTQLWVAARMDEANAGDFWGWHGLEILGRLRPGVTLASAGDELAMIAEQVRLENPLWRPAEGYVDGIEIVPLRDAMVGDVRTLLFILLAATGAVLLIACVNVANLTLARALGRSREVAIRTALGAGRSRVVRHLVAESLLLALIGGAAGLVIAAAGVDLLRTFLPADTPRLSEVALDPRVLAFTLMLAVLTGVACGVIPALRASSAAPASVLGDGARGASVGRAQRRLSGALVVAEIALAVVLVAGAALLLRSFHAMRQVDPGFATANLVTARLDPVATRYREPARRIALWESIVERVGAVPGIEHVGATTQLPFRGRSGLMATRVEGADQDPGNLPMLYYQVVTPGYLQAIGVPVTRGRGLAASDRAGAPDVVVVNEAMVRRFWPNEDPIGKRIGYPWPSDWLTVVGVVADVREGGLALDAEPAIYRPFHQAPEAAMSIVVRVDGARGASGTAAATAGVRSIVAAIDADMPVSDIRTMEERVAHDVARPRVTASLLVSFAVIALALGAVGIYGVIAYAVGRRTREIGVRMALGARRRDVATMVLREGAVLAGAGIAIGVGGAVFATRTMRGLLYGIEPGDPATLAAVSLVLLVVALGASWLPARRAAGVDPAVALQSD